MYLEQKVYLFLGLCTFLYDYIIIPELIRKSLEAA